VDETDEVALLVRGSASIPQIPTNENRAGLWEHLIMQLLTRGHFI